MVFNEYVMSESMIVSFIKILHSNSARGIGDNMSEYLKYALDLNMIYYLSVMFS